MGVRSAALLAHHTKCACFAHTHSPFTACVSRVHVSPDHALLVMSLRISHCGLIHTGGLPAQPAQNLPTPLSTHRPTHGLGFAVPLPAAAFPWFRCRRALGSPERPLAFFFGPWLRPRFHWYSGYSKRVSSKRPPMLFRHKNCPGFRIQGLFGRKSSPWLGI